MVDIQSKNNRNRSQSESDSVSAQQVKEEVISLITTGESVSTEAGMLPLCDGVPTTKLVPAKPFLSSGLIAQTVMQKEVKINKKQILQALQHMYVPDLISTTVDTIVFPSAGESGHTLNNVPISQMFDDYDPSDPQHQLGFCNRFKPITYGDDNIPVIAWDVVVKQNDIRYAPASVVITGVFGSTAAGATESTLDNQTVVYTSTLQLKDVTRGGHIVILPLCNAVNYSTGVLGALDSHTSEGVTTYQISGGVCRSMVEALRPDVFQIGLPLNNPIFNNPNNNLFKFGWRIAGTNAIVYVKPIFPSPAVVKALGISCLEESGDAYGDTMMSVYNLF